ncbi:hypothetical protein GQ457_18G004660 [Hibiscus cannabinus]
MLSDPILDRLIGNATTTFVDLVLSGELIENAIKNGKIEGSSSQKKPSLGRKNNEVNSSNVYNVSYTKPATIIQPKAASNTEGSSKLKLGQRKNTERIEFTPIPMTYNELYRDLFNAHVISPFHVDPLQPPFPKCYDSNAQCDYHAGLIGHSVENCVAFKKVVERLIKRGIVKIEEPATAVNPLPNHGATK